MKNLLARIAIIVCFLLTFVNKAEATHAMGGDIWYECNGGNSYTIYYAFYRDCDGVNAPNTVTIDITSSCAGASQLTLSKIPGTGQDITPTCDGQPSNCSGGTYPGVEKYVYSATVNLVDCADWAFSEAICCRNNAITNIANPGNERMYIQATLDNLNNPCNSSPTFSSDPVPYVCVGQTFCFNHGAIDSEGDSVAFQLVTPFDQNATTTVNYNAGFNPNQPISSNPAMTFNSQNGDICMTPSAQEVSVTAVVVEHWSNGQLVGTIMRDIQIRVINCDNQIPTTDGIDASTNYSTSACAGSPLVFNTFGDDMDAGNLLTMSWNGGIPGATFTVANNGTTDPVGTFSWTPGLTEVSTNPYCFTVTVQDDACPLNGFQTYAYCITVGGGTIDVAATTTDPNCDASCDGQIVASAIGGSPAFDFSLDGVNFSPLNTFAGLCAGSYDVYVQDANGCSDVETVQLVDPPPMTIASTATPVSCFGVSDGVLNVVPSGGVPGYTYFWIGGGTTSNITNAAAGWHSVSVTDANGCVRVQSVFVTEPPELLTTLTSTNSTCAGNDGSVTLNTTGGTPPYSYSWSHDPLLNLGTATGLAAGQYTVIVTDASGCTTTNSVTITITGTVTPGFLYNGNQCLTGNSYVFTNTGTPGVSYSWDFGDGLGTSVWENQTYTYASSGTYTVEQTVIDGVCTATTSMNVVVYDEPSMTYVPTDPLCNGDANGSINVTALGGTPAYIYSWSNGAQVQDLYGITSGTYDLTLSDINGCQVVESIVLTDPAVLSVASTSVSAFCQEVCDGVATATASGGTMPYSYVWDDPANQTGIGATALCDGVYTVTVTDDNNCVATSIETISHSDPISVSFAITNSNCGQADGEITATVVNGTPNYSYQWSGGGGTNPTFSSASSGIYPLNVQDGNGCVLDTSVNLSDNAAPTVSISSFTDVLCFSDSTGTATALAIGGAGGYSYTWSPLGGSNAIANNLPAGSYAVEVEDVAGCITSTTVDISEPTELETTTNSTIANCDQPDGQVNVFVSGGTVAADYQYTWLDETTFIGNTDTINGVSNGKYYVFVTDDNGCVAEDSVSVFDSPILKLAASSSDISCFGLCDGEASVMSTSGGVNPYTYSWNDPSLPPTTNQTNLCSGTYIVYATDAAGCVMSDTVTIEEPTPVVVVQDLVTNPTCFSYSDGEATVHATGGTAGYSYQWDAQTNNQAGTIASNLPNGDYVVIATDNNGCSASSVISIVEPLEIQLSGTSVNAHCNLPDGSATVNIVVGGFTPFTYSWTGSSSTNSTTTDIAPGTYTVQVTDLNGCQNSTDITVDNTPEGTATISNTVNPSCFASCDGESTVSMSGTGTPPYSYSWTNTNNDITATATGLCGGVNYFVTVTDANGCTSPASTIVVDPPVLSLNLATLDASCFGQCSGEILATASGGTAPYSYLWDDAGAQVTQTALGLCANTNYTVTVTDANGCQITGTESLGQPSLLVLDSSVVNSHCGQLDGSACIGITGGATPYVTSWEYNGSASLCQNNISSGTYIVNVADANDCVAEISVTVKDVEGPTASVSSTTDASCTGFNDGQATVSVTGEALPFSYQWDAAANSQITPTASNLPVGSYTVLITDSAGCIASTSVTINEPPPLDIGGILNDPSCFQYSDGSISVNVLGGTPLYNYSWSHNSSLVSSTASNLASGSYVVEVTDDHNCSELMNFQLTNPVPVTATLSPTNLTCFEACNGNIVVNPLTGFAPYTYQWDDSNQQTGSIASNLCVGDYAVIVSDNNGCMETVQTTLTQPDELLVSINIFRDATCNNVCDGYAQALISGGVGPYTYQWSSGSTDQVAQDLCAGTYVVVVTDANSCVSFAEIVIGEPTPINISTIIADASCYGTCDGTAEVIVTGGTSPYGYQWNDPNLQTSPGVVGLCAGTFTIAITDANDCYSANDVIIGQPSLLSMVVNTTSANCGQANGNACVSVIGGIPPYSYYWNDPSNQISACAFNIASGSYVATIVDGNNCVADSIISVNDISGPVIDFIQSTDASCFNGNSGSIQMDVNGGTLPYFTYQWIDNTTGNTTGPVNNPNLPGITAGCYTLEVTDDAGCFASKTECITEPSQLNLTVTNIVDATCNGGCDGMATALHVGGTAPYALLWDNGQNSVLASGLCAGIHDVTVTDGNNCQTTSNVLIDEPPIIVTTQTGGGVTSCFGDCDGTIELSTSGGTAPYFYNWLPDVSSSSMASGLCVGSYTVQTIDGSGCIINSNHEVTSPAALDGSITAIDATCGDCNGSSTMTGTGGTSPYNYLWDNGQSSQTANLLCPGQIEGTVIDANGCEFKLNASISDQAGPVITGMTTVDPSCNGSTNGVVSTLFSGGTSPFTYSWTNTTATDLTALFLGAGTYCVTMSDANGCTDVACADLVEPTSVVAVIDGQDSICFGDSIQIWASASGGNGGPYTITWLPPDTDGFVGPGPIMVDPETITSYCFNATDNNSCISDDPGCIEVYVYPSLSLVVGDEQYICPGDTMVFDTETSGGSGDPYSFEWYIGSIDPANFIGSDSSLVLADSLLVLTSDTSVVYYVTLDDGCSLPSQDSVKLITNPTPTAVIELIDSAGCSPYEAEFMVHTDVGTQIIWDFECDNEEDFSSTDSTAGFEYILPGVYDLCVTVISDSGCINNAYDSSAIEVFPVPVADFSLTPPYTTEIDARVLMSNLSVGDSTWKWDFNGDGVYDDSTTHDPIYDFETEGEYQVTLFVENEYGCTNVHVEVLSVGKGQAIYVPNTFTPNEDGHNDFFFAEVSNVQTEDFELLIFNRWGEFIWGGYTTDAKWDGTTYQEKSQQDTYVWKIRYRDINGVIQELMGHVNLLR